MKLLNDNNIKEVLEKQLYQALVNSISNGWKSGIDDIVKDVVKDNYNEIYFKYNEILKETLKSKDFGKAISDEFKRKIAKNMVGKLEGQVEHAVNAIRQDQTLRAKMIVAIEKIIEENN